MGPQHGPFGLAPHLIYVSRFSDEEINGAGRAFFVFQPPQSALPKRGDADEEHDYPEKDGADGVRAPLTLIEATELDRCRLRHLRGTQGGRWHGRGVRDCMRGHCDFF